MARKTSVFQRLLDEVDLSEEALPKQPIVELLGDGRVLIENHRGVIQYGSDQIRTRVSFGTVCVVGSNLRLRLMTGEKLVILGRIDGVEIQRGQL